MSHPRLSFARKILFTSIVATLLLCAPMQLVAQERESPAAAKASVIEWASGLWSNLTALLTGGAPAPRPTPTTDTDNGCAVDPHGGCGG